MLQNGRVLEVYFQHYYYYYYYYAGVRQWRKKAEDRREWAGIVWE
jgi:hypothetical protein